MGIRSSAFDLPGCGQDRTPRTRLTLADLVDSVVAHIDKLEARRIRLVGHSNGGWLLPPVAAELAARRNRENTVAGPAKQNNSVEVVELVFVGAPVLRRGESGLGVIPTERQPGYYIMAEASDENSLLLDFESAWGRFFSISTNHAPARSMRCLRRMHLGRTCRQQPWASRMSPFRGDTSP